MGLFGGSSKSYASTSYSDNSTNLSVDMSSGDLGSGASENIIAGGNVNVDGLSDDLAKTIFSYTDSSYKNSSSVLQEALNKSISGISDAYNKATSFIETAIGNNDTKTQNTLSTVTQSLQNAYNSEASTISSLKTFVLYGVIGFIAYEFLKRK